MSFKYEPNRVKVDKDRIRYDDNKAWQSANHAGKGDTPRHNHENFRTRRDLIDWSK